jgi:hypothetical protein
MLAWASRRSARIGLIRYERCSWFSSDTVSARTPNRWTIHCPPEIRCHRGLALESAAAAYPVLTQANINLGQKIGAPFRIKLRTRTSLK